MPNALAHADEIDSSVLAGHNISRLKVLGLLTDADVAASSTVDALRTAIENNVGTIHVDQDWSFQGDRAVMISEALGDLTDAIVAAASTVQDLVDETSADADGLFQSMTIE